MLKDTVLEKLNTEGVHCALIAYKDGYVHNTIKAALTEGYGAMSTEVYGDGSSLINIVDSADTMDMFAENKLIILENFKRANDEKGRTALLAYCKNPNPTTKLVIFDDADVFSFLGSAVKTISLAKPARGAIIDEISAIAASRSVRMDYDICSALMQKVGDKLDSIVNETIKVCEYVGKGGTVTMDDVDTCVLSGVEQATYIIAQLLTEGKNREAVAALARLRSINTSASFILASLSRQYRLMFFGAMSKLSDYELATALGVKEYSVNRARVSAKKYSQMALKRMLEKLNASEYRFKSGIHSDESAVDLSIAYIIQQSARK